MSDETRRSLLTMSKLGRQGRFGNQILQYAFLRVHAKRTNSSVQTAAWRGQQLFQIDDPPVSVKLPAWEEYFWRDRDASERLGWREDKPTNLDLQGYFQYHTSLYRKEYDFLESVFALRPAFLQIAKQIYSRLTEGKKRLFCLHLRRGDYGRGYYYIAPESWYLQHLETLNFNMANDVLYIASDGLDQVKQAFCRFPYRSRQDLADLQAPEMLVDFLAIMLGDVLLIPNSTFSFSASLLSPKAQVVFRSDPRKVAKGKFFKRIHPRSSFPLDRSATVARFPFLAPAKSEQQPDC